MHPTPAKKEKDGQKDPKHFALTFSFAKNVKRIFLVQQYKNMTRISLQKNIGTNWKGG